MLPFLKAQEPYLPRVWKGKALSTPSFLEFKEISSSVRLEN